MKTIFDKNTREEIINRINSLQDGAAAQWGKMNVHQMIKHCTLWEEMIQGKKQYKRMFVGRLFGKMALKKVLSDEAPLRRSTPTLSNLIIADKTGDITAQKTEWIARINAYANFSNPNYEHAFFGKMTEEQIGYMVYKHIDHHLRQFNA